MSSDKQSVKSYEAVNNIIFKNSDELMERMSFFEVFLNNLENFRMKETFCDVVLVSGIDNNRIHAHRNVLSASSAFFLAMFTNDLRESIEDEVTIAEVPGAILEALVDFCYSGLIDLNESNVVDTLVAANFLQLKEAVEICGKSMAKQLNSSNCLDYELFAEQHNCNFLLNLAKTYTSEHFFEVCKGKEFLEITADKLGELLQRDDIQINSEEDVFLSLKSWVEHDLLNRKKHIPKLLPFIRLPLLSPTYIGDNVEIIDDSLECKDLVIKALKWHFMPEQRERVNLKSTVRRKSALITISYLQDNSLFLQTYNTLLNEWIKWEVPERKFALYEVVRSDSKLIFIANPLQCPQSPNMLSLNAATKLWNFHCGVGYRSDFGIGILNEQIYIIGGRLRGSNSSTVQRYNPNSGVCEYTSNMNYSRNNPLAASLNGLLYVVGSVVNYSVQKMECYNPEVNNWTNKSSCNYIKTMTCLTASSKFLYAAGFKDNSGNYMERYDPSTDTWSLICDWERKPGCVNLLYDDDRLFGILCSESTYTLSEFDWHTNKFIHLVQLPWDDIRYVRLIPHKE